MCAPNNRSKPLYARCLALKIICEIIPMLFLKKFEFALSNLRVHVSRKNRIYRIFHGHD